MNTYAVSFGEACLNQRLSRTFLFLCQSAVDFWFGEHTDLCFGVTPYSGSAGFKLLDIAWILPGKSIFANHIQFGYYVKLTSLFLFGSLFLKTFKMIAL